MIWTMEEAKERFEELVEKARTEGPQRVRTTDGAVFSVGEVDQAKANGGESKESIIDYFLNGPSFEGVDLTRDKDLGRDVEL
jgi:hypothetical protein